MSEIFRSLLRADRRDVADDDLRRDNRRELLLLAGKSIRRDR